MYNIAFYRWEQYGDKVLLTNEMGYYSFLETQNFQAFVDGDLDGETAIFQELKEKGFLYTGDKNAYVRSREGAYADMKSCLFAATELFILVLTYSCNQKCVYCQAGAIPESRNMTKDICKKAIDIAVQSPVNHVTIEFQGGEPTLNREVLQFAVSYAKKKFYEAGKKVRFEIVTNLTGAGVDILRWLHDEGVHISTSLDGPKFVHDYNRPMVSGDGSYDQWENKVEEVKAIYEIDRIGAIETTTKAVLEYPDELIETYIQHGMDSIYVRPLTPLGYARKAWDQIGYTPEEYLDFYRKLVLRMIELCQQGIYISETTASIYLRRILLHESVRHTEHRSPCGAAVGQMAFNYDGKVYTCDEGRMLANMGDDNFCLGSVENNYRELITSPVAHAVCVASCIETLPFCVDCVYAPYCAACPVVTYGLEGDLISHEKRNYRCAISKGILGFLFELLEQNDEEINKILLQWAEND